MRTLLIVAAVATVATALPAQAQHVARSGHHMSQPGRASVVTTTHNRQRWGNRIGGRWYAGVDAPGGWSAYRRPVRGWQLPRYWSAPSFSVHDYASYGLGQPAPGYAWMRYYDDAVLIDDRSRVHDSVSGIDWDGGAYVDGDETYVDRGQTYADRTDSYADRDDAYVERNETYVDRGAAYPAPSYERRRDNGVGGALIGGVVGGVAGNVIAGRGNRLAGTLIGAGTGAIVGSVIDRAEDRRVYANSASQRRPGNAYGYPAGSYGYESRGASADARHHGSDAHRQGGHPGRVIYDTPHEVVQRHHVEGGAGGYDSRGYAGHGYPATSYYTAPGTTTVITIQPAVTTTTTTTEYITEYAPRRAYRAKKPVHRAKPRQCACHCVRVCR